jgi:hypothetical protein
MVKELTEMQCKRKLFNLGIKLGVSPKLIATRLLSNKDKQDMLDGLISDESLVTGVKVWMEGGMCDLAGAKFEPYKANSTLPMQRYRGNGKS